ncbi:MAG TPA: hypothetical protein VIJ22_11940 [Polyangiaceae bacterium]
MASCGTVSLPDTERNAIRATSTARRAKTTPWAMGWPLGKVPLVCP